MGRDSARAWETESQVSFQSEPCRCICGNRRSIYTRQATREKLGGDGGIGGAFHIHAHIEDQEVIQEDIDDAGHHQKDQRGTAVPQGTGDIGYIVEKHGRTGTGKDYDEVIIGLFQNLRGSVHGNQNGAGKGTADNGEDHSGSQGEQRTAGNAPAHAFLIAGAITLGHTDRKSGGKALCKADNQEGDAAGTADGSQGIHTDGTAHDKGICHAVKLLKNVSDQQRQCKEDQKLYNVPGSHGTLFHRSKSLRFYQKLRQFR